MREYIPPLYPCTLFVRAVPPSLWLSRVKGQPKRYYTKKEGIGRTRKVKRPDPKTRVLVWQRSPQSLVQPH